MAIRILNFIKLNNFHYSEELKDIDRRPYIVSPNQQRHKFTLCVLNNAYYIRLKQLKPRTLLRTEKSPKHF